MKKVKDGLFYPDSKVPLIRGADIELLKSAALESERRRARFCAHNTENDRLHDMLIVLHQDTYVPPHTHLRPESGHVIEGLANLVFFNSEGKINGVVNLGDYSSGENFFYRIPGGTYHTQIIKSKFFIFHEAVPGPFEKENMVLAPWAPDERDFDARKKYTKDLIKRVKKFSSNSSF